jgi:hypothetical protein
MLRYLFTKEFGCGYDSYETDAKVCISVLNIADKYLLSDLAGKAREALKDVVTR